MKIVEEPKVLKNMYYHLLAMCTAQECPVVFLSLFWATESLLLFIIIKDIQKLVRCPIPYNPWCV